MGGETTMCGRGTWAEDPFLLPNRAPVPGSEARQGDRGLFQRAVALAALARYLFGIQHALRHPSPPFMSDSPLSLGQALARWLIQVLIFVVAGGAAAGVSSLVYETLSAAENNVVVYGVVFAGAGWIAYQLSRRVLDG